MTCFAAVRLSPVPPALSDKIIALADRLVWKCATNASRFFRDTFEHIDVSHNIPIFGDGTTCTSPGPLLLPDKAKQIGTEWGTPEGVTVDNLATCKESINSSTLTSIKLQIGLDTSVT